MKTFLAGHRGMAGSAIARQLKGDVITRTRSELDLTDQAAVRAFFQAEKPEQVILAAAIGGAAFMPITATPPSSSTRT